MASGYQSCSQNPFLAGTSASGSLFYLKDHNIMSLHFTGRVAIVTGAGGGLGKQHALALAARGAKVVVNDLGADVHGDGGSVSAAQAVVDEIRANGGEAMVNGASVTDYEAVKAMVQQTMDAWGRVDILVNNAGIQHVAKIEDFPIDRWDAVLAINLSSAFHAMRLALPAMKAANWGRIINVSSAHGLVGSAEKSAYVAAKHGLIGLTKVAALETATSGVTCNAICPGWVLTPLVQRQVDAKAAAQNISIEEAQRQLLGEKEPSMQFTTPEELGELAVFFCSPAGNNVRGVAWNMDGGWVAQ
jgi:3-hydroxybutyrate dehydrogenase